MRECFAGSVVILVSIIGCLGPDPGDDHRFTRFTMGTVVEYTIVAPDGDVARAAVNAAHFEMERVSRLLWEDDSLSAVHAINRATDSVMVPDEAREFLLRAQRVADRTGGAFDPTIKPVFDLYGFDTSEPRPPAESEIREKLTSVGYDRYRTGTNGYVVKDTAALALAVGGVAKGYAVDRAIAVLKEAGIGSGIVNAGGDLYCFGRHGSEPWKVGLRDPDVADEIAAVLHVQDAAVATSGDYQQFYQHEGIRYHHILDPVQGTPSRGTRSATVVSVDTERADALATALFVLGAVDGLAMLDSLPGADGLVIDSAGNVYQTAGMSEYLVELYPQRQDDG